MTTLAHKRVYLTLDSVDVSDQVVAVELEQSSERIDVTAGTTAAHRQYAPGLSETRFAATINYDADAISAYMAALRPGQVVALDYGIEGDGEAEPHHTGAFLLTRVNVKRDRAKSLVSFAIEAISADTPDVNLWE